MTLILLTLPVCNITSTLKSLTHGAHFMKRINFILMILMGIILFGCGSQSSEKQQEPSKSPGKEPITISVNSGPKDTEPREVERWNLLVSMFEEKYPDIKVDVQYWEYEPAIFMTRAVGGQLSDIINTWATEGEILITKKLAADITDVLTSWEDFQDMRPILLEPFHRNNRYYAFPTSAYSMGLYYNKRLFRNAGVVDEKGEANPPRTWEQFLEAAKKIANPDKGICGFAILGGHHARAGWHFLNWGWQGGGEFEKKLHGKWKASFNEPGVILALKFIKDLRWKHNVLQANVLDDDRDISQSFAAGRVGMFIGPANANTIVALKENFGFDLENLGIASLPEGPGGNYVQMGADLYIFRPGIEPEKKKAAFKWCTFCVSNEWKEAEWKLRKKQGLPVGAPYIPIFKGERHQQWEEILEKNRTIPRFSKYQENVVNHLKTEPPYYCQQLYKEVLGPSVQEVLTNKDSDPRAILEEHAENFQKQYLDKIKP